MCDLRIMDHCCERHTLLRFAYYHAEPTTLFTKPISSYTYGTNIERFYAQKQLLLSARLSHRNSVRPSVCPSVCHTGGSVKNGPS